MEMINPYELRARLAQNSADPSLLPEIRRQLNLCLEQHLSDSLPIILANLALYLVARGPGLATAQQLYAFVQTLPGCLLLAMVY